MYDDEMIFQLVSAPSDRDSLVLQVAVNRVVPRDAQSKWRRHM